MGNNIQKTQDIFSSLDSKSGSPVKVIQRGGSYQKTSTSYPFLSKLGKILEEKSFEGENVKGISENTFVKYICTPSRITGVKLYKYFLKNDGDKQGIQNGKDDKNANIEVKPGTKLLAMKEFVIQSSELLECLNDSQQLEYYINVFSDRKDEINKAEIEELIMSAYDIAHFSQPSHMSDDLLSAMTKTIMHGKDKVSCKYVFNWVCEHTPRLVSGMHRYLCQILTISYSTIPNGIDLKESCTDLPVLERTKASCAADHQGMLWLLSCLLPQQYLECLTPSTPSTPSEECISSRKFHKYMGKLKSESCFSNWVPLYNSDEHGLSVNRFQHHIFDYRGPTLLFIQSVDMDLFCVASDVEWRDSKHFFGGYDSMCLQLLPEYKVIERGANMLYFNITSRGFPTGLQVGTDHRNRSLSFDINMEVFYYKQIPFKLKSIETWGCGSSSIKETQKEYKKQANKDAENRQKVKLNEQDWRDNPDRYLLELAGTRHNYVSYENDSPSPN